MHQLTQQRVIVNGVAGASIDALDRGLQFGDGLFETLAILDEVPQLWESHLERLQRSCASLGLPLQRSESLLAEVTSLCSGVQRGVLKIILTRGSGGRGYRPSAGALPTRIIAVFPWPEFPPRATQDGVTVRICDTCLGLSPALAGIKHLNRLEQVLARREWEDPEIAEGLMRDLDGYLVEGTMSNLFIVRDGRLMTPDLNRCGVAGIMRGFILATARELGIEAVTKRLHIVELTEAEEAFVCNSLIGLWPIRDVMGLDVSFHNGNRVTLRMISALASKGIVPE